MKDKVMKSLEKIVEQGKEGQGGSQKEVHQASTICEG
jgi:hypothetical protein